MGEGHGCFLRAAVDANGYLGLGQMLSNLSGRGPFKSTDLIAETLVKARV